MDRTEYSSKINAYMTEYIKFADLKAGAVLVIVSAIGALLKETTSRVLEVGRVCPSWVQMLGWIVGGTLVLAVVMTLWYAFAALNPRTGTASETTPSLNSFPDIARMGPARYVEAFGSLSDEAIAGHYATHNASLAVLAMRKFEAIAGAVRWLRLTLFSAFAFSLLFALAALYQPEDNGEHKTKPVSQLLRGASSVATASHWHSSS